MELTQQQKHVLDAIAEFMKSNLYFYSKFS